MVLISTVSLREGRGMSMWLRAKCVPMFSIRKSWVDSGYGMIHDFEVADMNVLGVIPGRNRKEQWENHNPNDDIRVLLETESVEEYKSVEMVRSCAKNE